MKKLWGIRYYLKTKNGFSLCENSRDLLLAIHHDDLVKNHKGETVQVIEQKQYTRENVDTVIEEFVIR